MFCGTEDGKPENPFGTFRDYRSDGMQAALRGDKDKYPEAGLSKERLALSRQSELEIMLDFSFPDGAAFVPEIHFDECGEASIWRLDFHVAVGNKRYGSGGRLMERKPADKLH